MNIKVEFQGTAYWWLKDDDGPEGPLAPLEHCDEDGELENWMGESFAQVTPDGKIKRYHKVIGTIDDLILL